QPRELKSEAGAAVTLHDDGSIVAEGGNVEAESDTLHVEASAGPVKALRIETGTNESPRFNEHQIIAIGSLIPETGVITGRYVRIDLPGDNRAFPRLASDGDAKFLGLAEVQVFQHDQNLALGKAARQSSTWDANGRGPFGAWEAARAVDGNTNGEMA